MVSLVIRVVNKNNIWLSFFYVVISIKGHRDILGKFFPLIVESSKRSILNTIIIGNRHYISITVRVSIGCHPDTFQRIPHGSFIGKKNHFQAYFYIISYAVFNRRQSFLKLSAGFIGIDKLMIPNSFMNLIELFAIIFQKGNGCKAFPF